MGDHEEHVIYFKHLEIQFLEKYALAEGACQ